MRTVLVGSNVFLDAGGDGPLPATIEMDYESGKILAVFPGQIRSREEYTESDRYIDAGELVVMPGIIDAHVHINEPGRLDWEGFYTATAAACHGGCTTIVDMPLNSIPPTTTLSNFEQKIEAAKAQCWINVGFYGGVIPGNSTEIKKLIRRGVLGFKCFMIESGVEEFPHVSEQDIVKALIEFKDEKSFLMFHAELASSEHNHAKEQRPPEKYDTFLCSRPDSLEVEAIEMVIRLCRRFDVPCHIVHLSSAKAIPLIRQAKKDGVALTVETTFHYLFFDAENIPDGATQFKCCPPIRSSTNKEELWAALQEGLIDYVVSDHSPCTVDLKKLETGDFMSAWGGIASVQFGLPIMWSEAKKRGISIHKLLEWMVENPARRLSLEKRKGKILAGYDADIVVWNPVATLEITKAGLHFKNKLTPYEQLKLFGVVEYTFVGGKVVYMKDEGLVGSPRGSLIFSN